MMRWPELDHFLTTDPRDVGCAEAMADLHVYVEFVLTGGDPATRFPGVFTHLAWCRPCAEDCAGLLAAVRAEHR